MTKPSSRLLFLAPERVSDPLSFSSDRPRFPLVFVANMIFSNLKRTEPTLSCMRKACETLAQDLRGYGTHLIAPETTDAYYCPAAGGGAEPQPLREPRQERCATAGAAEATRTRTKTEIGAWSASRSNGGKDGSSGGSGDSSRPPPFGPVRGSTVTVQEARTSVVIDQVGGDVAGRRRRRR